jgi:E3 ubiquitin-protein ligase MYLIP
MVTNSGKCVYLTITNDEGEMRKMWFLLVSKKAANGLYRCVTEMHSFYRCDTVRNAVSSQYSRDIKGTIISIFNENTTLGRLIIVLVFLLGIFRRAPHQLVIYDTSSIREPPKVS